MNTTVEAAMLSQKLQIKLSVSPSHSILMQSAGKKIFFFFGCVLTETMLSTSLYKMILDFTRYTALAISISTHSIYPLSTHTPRPDFSGLNNASDSNNNSARRVAL